MPRLRYYMPVAEGVYMGFNGNSNIYSPLLEDLGVKLALDPTDKLVRGAPAKQNSVVTIGLKLNNLARTTCLCSISKLGTAINSIVGKPLTIGDESGDILQVSIPKRTSYR